EVLLKYALALNKLLQENKTQKSENKKSGVKDIKLISSFGELSSETGLRKATLSAIFSGTSNPEALTIELILKALRKNYSQFSNYYDHFSDKDLLKFKAEI